MGLLLGDVLEEFRGKKKTGALFIVVYQSTDYMVRFYFNDGEILYLSFGPLKGQECIELLEYYDLGMAVFFAEMKPPRFLTNDLPMTSKIIEILTGFRKTVSGVQFTGREKAGGEDSADGTIREYGRIYADSKRTRLDAPCNNGVEQRLNGTLDDASLGNDH